MGQASSEIIHEVEKGLEHRMSSVMSQQFENAGSLPNPAKQSIGIEPTIFGTRQISTVHFSKGLSSQPRPRMDQSS